MITTGTEKLETVQDIRALLVGEGFAPLTLIGNAEHWARDARRVVLSYEGADVRSPGDVAASEATLQYAYIVGSPETPRLSLA